MQADIFDDVPIEGSVSTSSKLKAWWLRTARGYRVASLHRLPKQNFFGELYYKTQYILTKRPE